MSLPSQILPLEQAAAGMTLAEDVKDGRSVLLPKGTVLNAAQLSSLGRRGVTQLSVLCPAATPSPEEIEATRARLERLFRRVGDDDLSRALQRAVLDFRGGAPK